MSEEQRREWEELIAEAARQSPRLADSVRAAMRTAMMMQEAEAAVHRAEALPDLSRGARRAAEQAPDRSRLRAPILPRIEPSESARRALHESLWPQAAELTSDLPVLRAKAGDLLVVDYEWNRGLREHPPEGTLRWLRLEEYETLRALPCGAIRDFRDQSAWWTPRGFLSDRKRWGKRLKVWHSRLALVKPLRLSDTWPVGARSDDGAILELTPFSGHPISTEKGVHNAEIETAVPSRVPGADH